MKHPITESEAKRIAKNILEEWQSENTDAILEDKIAQQLETAHMALNRLFRILHTNRSKSKLAQNMLPYIKDADNSIIFARDML